MFPWLSLMNYTNVGIGMLGSRVRSHASVWYNT